MRSTPTTRMQHLGLLTTTSTTPRHPILSSTRSHSTHHSTEKGARATRPRVYEKMKQHLLSTSETELVEDAIRRGVPVDGIEGLRKARRGVDDEVRDFAGVVGEGEGQGEKVVRKRKGFLERLKEDGGDKIVTFARNFIHVDHTRFIPLVAQVRGLSVTEAMLQAKWLRKRISTKFVTALEEAMEKAKKEGLDLEKTFVADAFVKKNGAILCQEMKARYLRGRGRFGATPHAKTALLEFVLQEREKGFRRKESDPLEWIRRRLRSLQLKDVVAVDADEKRGIAEALLEHSSNQIRQKKLGQARRVEKEIFC
ncbi:hypothetical protein HDU97_005338 [Phlyctochytrium planicorne]|nr:hypothetical protein HDU97_005338 [Phlyctochytrium planicorne]